MALLVRDRRGESGQVLVLGALSMLVLALMLMLSFNVSEAIHNKIQLQQEADAQAYSMAVIEARTFNYISYANRAIVSDLVAMTTLHAYMSMMSAEVSMFHGAKINMYEIGIFDLIRCFACEPIPCFNYCVTAGMAFARAGKYANAERKYASKLKKLDKLFNLAIASLKLSMDLIHGSELYMLVHLGKDILRGKGMDEIRTYNAPQSTPLPGKVGGLNLLQLSCALDGTPLGGFCPHGPGVTKAKKRAELITEIANATRSKGVAKHDVYENISLWFLKLTYQIPRPGFTIPFGTPGAAKVVKSKGANPDSGESPTVGNDIGSKDSGMVFSFLRDWFGIWTWKGDIYSDAKGGQHDPREAHSQTHNRFKGVGKVSPSKGCAAGGDCFIKFRANPSSKHAFDQPMVYAYTTRDLAVTRDGRHGPWEVNHSGKVQIGWGSQKGALTLRPGTGAAVSKAMVYYHRLGDWQDPPNFFSPYWRAKLQPFKRMEAFEVLTAAGNFDAAKTMLMAPTGPVN